MLISYQMLYYTESAIIIRLIFNTDEITLETVINNMWVKRIKGSFKHFSLTFIC
jgi:hypothetical protein